ncbi:hypothetical protein C474_13629 [Halogeometricum pallidum JCM 14848]|uniref:site-specific DNA-methyltransferase (adenine-specific) n=1 Tax=Halogeometricum pallidum JCM 14848 TaxID=1227487 RepID=M0D0B8_HALPD|nr:hypothetical protein C474_13629 [Halogeometricum pallidum JCM 14848]
MVEAQEEFSPDERKNRPLSPNESPDIADFCTYLVPSEEEGNPTDFEHPRELRIIDPACGSGHFLLYAFDVLERIWRAETDLPHEEIPRRILKHNLYGVDLDMRACQLAAFNLYLKGRTRTEVEEADSFDMPEVGIVCADSSVADIDGVEAVFDEVAGDDQKVEDALRRILDAFEEVHGLGSLLDVRGTLGDLFEDDSDVGGVQITLDDDPRQSHTLGQVLHSLREAVDEHRDSDSFLAQDLRSFVRLLDILAQDYDVALMNPPYGSRNRMPRNVRRYVNEHYKYTSEFYINFFEVCDNLVPDDGRIGMLVPRTFLFKSRFQDFREDFVGDEGSFDFLSEYGLGVLDNATVRTVGTVVRTGRRQQSKGTFIRLHDVDSENKENVFLNTIKEQSSDNIDRFFEISLNDFKRVPRNPICYSTPPSVRSLHENNTKIDAKPAEIDADSVSDALAGLQTSDDDRFARYFWETRDFKKHRPIAKGGAAAWILPKITETVEWDDDGRLLKRSSKSIRTRNEERYGEEGLTWTRVKETGRRFGYFPSSGLFSHTGFLLIPEDPDLIWKMMAVLNSDLYHCLFLSLTVERDWLAGEVGSVPWLEELSGIKELDKLAKRQYELSIQQNTTDPTSPYYIGPGLLPGDRAGFFYDHPHNKKSKEVQKEGPDSAETSVLDAGIENRKDSLRLQMELESIQNEINNKIYDSVGIDNEVVEDIEQEIHLRTSKTPNDRQIPDPEAVSHSQENISTSQSRLVRTSAC